MRLHHVDVYSHRSQGQRPVPGVVGQEHRHPVDVLFVGMRDGAGQADCNHGSSSREVGHQVRAVLGDVPGQPGPGLAQPGLDRAWSAVQSGGDLLDGQVGVVEQLYRLALPGRQRAQRLDQRLGAVDVLGSRAGKAVAGGGVPVVGPLIQQDDRARPAQRGPVQVVGDPVTQAANRCGSRSRRSPVNTCKKGSWTRSSAPCTPAPRRRARASTIGWYRSTSSRNATASPDWASRTRSPLSMLSSVREALTGYRPRPPARRDA